MPHAARPASRGFTLLELLMVVLLVGILSGIALISLNPGGLDRRLRDEADRLAVLMEQASNEAVMQNQEYGLMLTGDGYVFLCLDEVKQRWRECEERAFRRHALTDGLRLRVMREKRLTFTLSEPEPEEGEEHDESPRLQPDLYFLSSGEASPATLEMVVREDPALRREISIDEIGRIARDDEDDLRAQEAADAH